MEKVKKSCGNCLCLDRSKSKESSIDGKKLIYYGCSKMWGGFSMAFEQEKDECNGCCGAWSEPMETRSRNKGMAAELGKQIRSSLKHWQDLYKNGGSDPSWEDGCNLNLVRNHIFYYKGECERRLLQEDYPPEYYLEIPPEVDNRYMARSEEIRENAGKSLEQYLSNPDYKYLQNVLHRLSQQQISQTHITVFLNYPAGLRSSIERGNLLEMRRHEKPARYIEDFRICRERVEAILGKERELPLGQLSLSDLFDLTLQA